MESNYTGVANEIYHQLTRAIKAFMSETHRKSAKEALHAAQSLLDNATDDEIEAIPVLLFSRFVENDLRGSPDSTPQQQWPQQIDNFRRLIDWSCTTGRSEIKSRSWRNNTVTVSQP